MKKLIAFDVDNTLSLSRSEIDVEMANLLIELLAAKQVAIITGGAFVDIKKQVLDPLIKVNQEIQLSNLILLPTNGSGLWTFNQTMNQWTEIFSHRLTAEQKKKIIKAIEEIDQSDPELRNNISYGPEIEDRQSEITYSALGNKAPVSLKKDWDPDFKKRIAVQSKLMSLLPEFEVKIGGTTSIDITPKGMDKAYAVTKILEYSKLDKTDLIFIGDAIYENGNDYPVAQMGVETIKVSSPEDTKKIISSFVSG